MICQDIDTLTRYLLFSEAAVHDPSATSELSNLNWVRHQEGQGQNANPHVEKWGAGEFMGYYWWRVSHWRKDRGIALNLPAWPRLGGQMRQLLERMPREHVYHLINYLAYYFDIIRWQLGRMGEAMTLDETTLFHPTVQSAVQTLIGMCEEERALLIAKFQHQMGMAA